MDYIRERFWRGYSFPSLPQANRDMIAWLEETANQRIHGTHRQPILGRWKEEIPCLGKPPLADYDTSLKVFRKVYKDCQLSYNGNRYKVPYQAIGKKVMLKVKGQLIRIYHDQDPLTSYQEPTNKGQIIGDPGIYEQLKRGHAPLGRKYGQNKGLATRGLTNGNLYPDVALRPLAEYERYAAGGVQWNN